MKSISKRLFSLLLAVVLVLGLPSQAMAATNVGSSETTATQPTDATEPASAEASDPTQPGEPEETTSPTEPQTETEPEVSADATDPTDPTEPTDPPAADEEETGLIITPDPIVAENPYDPDWPYPYGLPVDNDFPDDLLEVDPYAISLMADMSLIPDEMYDNTILRALEYTGYDVQKMKDNGWLYVAQYTSSNINTYAPEVLSDIGYDDYSPFLNGDETVADSSTVTGLAPDIASFEASGMVCASFVTYYMCNYLPNIEGIDTTWIHDAVAATTMNNGSYSTASVWSWETGLTNLANTAGSGVTKYTDADTAYANLVPGDLIVFTNSSGDLTHIAVYAGTYTMYNASGTNRGPYHYIIHVGNSRGPEISAVEYMVSSGSKSSSPSAWYHIDLPEVQSTGFIEVYKKDPNGKNLSGAYFTAVDQATGDKYIIGPTDTDGHAQSGEMPLGTFVVTETVFPANYEASGTSSWTVTLTKDTPNMTITINAVNKLKTGYIEVNKEDEGGSPLAGATFTAVNQSTGVNYTIGPTNANGYAKTAVPYGTYLITESVFPDGFEASGTTSWTLTINDDTPNGTVTINAVNKLKTGYIEVNKEDEDGSPLAGATFTAVNQNTGVSYTLGPTDSNGAAKTAVPYGSYLISESVFPEGFEASGTTSWTVTINDDTPNGTVTVNAVNKKITGSLTVRKATTTGIGADLGWGVKLWRIEDDGTWTFIGSGTTKQDKNDPTYTFTGLEEGRYAVQEDESVTHPGYTLDVEYHYVDVVSGQTASVTITNTQLGDAKIIKSMPDGGSVAGWVFDVYRVSDNAYMGTYTSGEDGTIMTDYLVPGEYQFFEQIPEGSLYVCETENPQTVTIVAGQTAEVTFTNRLKPAEIVAYKVDTLGAPLAEVEFLLEWYDEVNQTWQPVTYTDSQYVTEGTCTSDGLKDGKLVSGKDGVVRFTGLHPERLYRLTETRTIPGYQLLTKPAYEGGISIEENLIVELTVVNAPVYELPMTGSTGSTVATILQIAGAIVLLTALLYIVKKRR